MVSWLQRNYADERPLEVTKKRYEVLLEELRGAVGAEVQGVLRDLNILTSSRVEPSQEVRKELVLCLVAKMEELMDTRFQDTHDILELLTKLLNRDVPFASQRIKGLVLDVEPFLKLLEFAADPIKRLLFKPYRGFSSQTRASNYWCDPEQVFDKLKVYIPLLRKGRHGNINVMQYFFSLVPVRSITQDQLESLVDMFKTERLENCSPANMVSLLCRIGCAELHSHYCNDTLPAPKAQVHHHLPYIYSLSVQASVTYRLLSIASLIEYKHYGNLDGLSQLYFGNVDSIQLCMGETSDLSGLGFTALRSLDTEDDDDDFEEAPSSASLDAYKKALAELLAKRCLNLLCSSYQRVGGQLAQTLLSLDNSHLSKVIERAQLADDVPGVVVGTNVELYEALVPFVMDSGTDDEKAWLLGRVGDLIEPSKTSSMSGALNAVARICVCKKLEGEVYGTWGVNVFEKMLNANHLERNRLRCLNTGFLLTKALGEEEVDKCCAMLDDRINNASQTSTELDPESLTLSLFVLLLSKVKPEWGIATAKRLLPTVRDNMDSLQNILHCNVISSSLSMTPAADLIDEVFAIADEYMKGPENWKEDCATSLMHGVVGGLAIVPPLEICASGFVNRDVKVSFKDAPIEQLDVLCKVFTKRFNALKAVEAPKRVDAMNLAITLQSFRSVLLNIKYANVEELAMVVPMPDTTQYPTYAEIVTVYESYCRAPGLMDRELNALVRAGLGLLSARYQVSTRTREHRKLFRVPIWKSRSKVLEALLNVSLVDDSTEWAISLMDLDKRGTDDRMAAALVELVGKGFENTTKSVVQARGKLWKYTSTLLRKCKEGIERGTGDNNRVKGYLELLSEKQVDRKKEQYLSKWSDLQNMAWVLVEACEEENDTVKAAHRKLRDALVCRKQLYHTLPDNDTDLSDAEVMDNMVQALVESKHEQYAVEFMAHIAGMLPPSHIPRALLSYLTSHLLSGTQQVRLHAKRALSYIMYNRELAGLPPLDILDMLDGKWFTKLIDTDRENEYVKTENCKQETARMCSVFVDLWRKLFVAHKEKLLANVQSAAITLTSENCAEYLQVVGGLLKAQSECTIEGTWGFVMPVLLEARNLCTVRVLRELTAMLPSSVPGLDEAGQKRFEEFIVMWIAMGTSAQPQARSLSVAQCYSMGEDNKVGDRAGTKRLLAKVLDLSLCTQYEAVRWAVGSFVGTCLVTTYKHEEEAECVEMAKRYFESQDPARVQDIVAGFVSGSRGLGQVVEPFTYLVQRLVAERVVKKKEYASEVGEAEPLEAMCNGFLRVWYTDTAQFEALVVMASKLPDVTFMRENGKSLLWVMWILVAGRMFDVTVNSDAVFWAAVDLFWKAAKQGKVENTVLVSKFYMILTKNRREQFLDHALSRVQLDTNPPEVRKAAATCVSAVALSNSYHIPTLTTCLQQLIKLRADPGPTVSRRANDELVWLRQSLRERPYTWHLLKPTLTEKGILKGMLTANSVVHEAAFS